MMSGVDVYWLSFRTIDMFSQLVLCLYVILLSIIDQLVGSVLIDVFSVTWSCMENGPGTKGQFRTSQPTTSWYHLLSTKLYGLVSQTQMNPSPGLNSMFNVDVQETGPKCVIFHPPILLSPATLNLSSRWCC
jgi:hypothetical protein